MKQKIENIINSVIAKYNGAVEYDITGADNEWCAGLTLRRPVPAKQLLGAIESLAAQVGIKTQVEPRPGSIYQFIDFC